MEGRNLNSVAGPLIVSESDVIDLSLLKLPLIDPDMLLGFTFTKDYGGDTFCAEVVDRLEDDRFLVQLGGGDGREEIMAYNELIDLFNAKYTDDDEEANLWTYDKVQDHHKVPNGMVEVCKCCGMMVLRPGNPFHCWLRQTP